jgi:hypothetical protein
MKTPAELRAEASVLDNRAAESFERCDTDGFLSQWADGLTARLRRAQADLAEAGGTHVFPALFDTEGNLVAAKPVDGQWSSGWGILAADDPWSRFVGYFNPSRARDPKRRQAADAAKGYQVGKVRAPAKAVMDGQGHGLSGTAWVAVKRTDGGFSRDVEIVTAADYGEE